MKQKYYQHEPTFNGVYSRNYLPKVRDRIYVRNLDDFKSRGTHWIALYVNGNNVIHFDNFGVEHITKELKNSLEAKIL